MGTPAKTDRTVEEIINMIGHDGLTYIKICAAGGNVVRAEIHSIKGSSGHTAMQHASGNPGLALQRAFDVWEEKRNKKSSEEKPHKRKRFEVLG